MSDDQHASTITHFFEVGRAGIGHILLPARHDAVAEEAVERR
jgi:hypothetical protein